MIDRERPNAAARWGASLMTRVYAVSEAGSSPRRLAATGATAHDRPSEAGHPENPGLRSRHLGNPGVNHIWSFAGDRGCGDVNSIFMQPFVTYTTQDAWTFALNTENSYNWEAEAWAVPINFTVSKLVVIEKQPISLSPVSRYWAKSPENGPTDLDSVPGQPCYSRRTGHDLQLWKAFCSGHPAGSRRDIRVRPIEP